MESSVPIIFSPAYYDLLLILTKRQ
jgi:hypothetical protein